MLSCLRRGHHEAGLHPSRRVHIHAMTLLLLGTQVYCCQVFGGEESARQNLIFDPTGQLLRWFTLLSIWSLECPSWLELAKWDPRDQMGLFEVLSAAGCDQTQLLHLGGHENN